MENPFRYTKLDHFSNTITKNENKANLEIIITLQKQPVEQTRNTPPKEEDECCICFDALSASEIKELKCKHMFHVMCIRKWVELKNDTCPLCRDKMIVTFNHLNNFITKFEGQTLSTVYKHVAKMFFDAYDSTQTVERKNFLHFKYFIFRITSIILATDVLSHNVVQELLKMQSSPPLTSIIKRIQQDELFERICPKIFANIQ